jgi:hypothetical protein
VLELPLVQQLGAAAVTANVRNMMAKPTTAIRFLTDQP